MMKTKGLVVALVVLCCAFFAIGEGLEPVTLRLNWIPGGDHCFYYVAKELGFYESNGLDVTIERGQGSGDTVKRVELGTVDIGLADTGTVVVARSQGAKVKVIAIIYSQSPNGIKTRRDTGITCPKDLEGHTVGVPPGDAQRVLWPALAKANGIDMNKVALVNIKPGAKAQSLAARVVDAVFDWIVGNVQYWQAGLGRDELVIIPWAAWGVNPYGNAIIASEKTIEERPDMLRRFLDATMKAWQWSLLHPDEAIEIFTNYNPEVPPLAALVRFVDDARNLVDCEQVRLHVLGWIDHDRMVETVNDINEYFEVERPVTAEEMYTTAFLPHYALPPLDQLPTVDELWERWKAER